MKRVTMGGTDAVVTDDRVADLILDYARELGRVGRTDTVTVPAEVEGQASDASMLLGPASQITVTPDLRDGARPIDLPDLEPTLADLRDRIDRLSKGTAGGPGATPGPTESFVDYARYDVPE